MRIVIAEDSVLLRAGLTRILIDAGEDVVATVGDADELLTTVARHQPDLAVVDVRMPPTMTDDGLRAALQVRERWPGVAILVLSQYVEERYATELIARDTSSVGYLLKDRIADVSEFLGAVRRVGAGCRSARSAHPSHHRPEPEELEPEKRGKDATSARLRPRGTPAPRPAR